MWWYHHFRKPAYGHSAWTICLTMTNQPSTIKHMREQVTAWFSPSTIIEDYLNPFWNPVKGQRFKDDLDLNMKCGDRWWLNLDWHKGQYFNQFIWALNFHLYISKTVIQLRNNGRLMVDYSLNCLNGAMNPCLLYIYITFIFIYLCMYVCMYVCME